MSARIARADPTRRPTWPSGSRPRKRSTRRCRARPWRAASAGARSRSRERPTAGPMCVSAARRPSGRASWEWGACCCRFPTPTSRPWRWSCWSACDGSPCIPDRITLVLKIPLLRTAPIYCKSLVGLLLGTCITAPAGAQAMDSLAVARRIVAAASLAAKEYAIGVAPRGGRVTNPEEVSEAKQFLDQARLDVGSLPRAVRATADSDLVALHALLDRAAPPDSVAARAGLLVQHIATAVGDALETFPSRPPSLVRGAAVYQEQCAQCHGASGRGDGPKAKQLQGPPPASLADRQAMSAVSPLDVYRKL